MIDIGIAADSPQQLQRLLDNKIVRVLNGETKGHLFSLGYPVLLIGCCGTTRIDSPADVPRESTEPCAHGYQAVHYTEAKG